MIVEMQKGSKIEEIQQVVKRIRGLGFKEQLNPGEEKTVIAVLGSETGIVPTETFEVLPGVEKVVRIMKPYKLASRDFKPEDTIVQVGDVKIGGKEIVIMAGPCAVETEEQIISTAELVKKLGGKVLRGGAYKPSTSPFKFQGLGEEGLKLLALAREKTGLKIITEVMDPRDVAQVSEHADILQIGTRNAQNFSLLKEAGMAQRPILLKRGFSSTVEEWLQAADYILERDNSKLILCERGIRTFETSTRFTLDLNSVSVINEVSHLPVVVDPSHPSGNWVHVSRLARGSVATGVVDGLLIEVHPNPKQALKDGPQSLTFSDFSRLMGELKAIAKAIGREV